MLPSWPPAPAPKKTSEDDSTANAEQAPEPEPEVTAETEQGTDEPIIAQTNSGRPWYMPFGRRRPEVECEACEVPAGECATCEMDFPMFCTVLPDGLLYRSYIAGPKEPRFASAWLNEQGRGMIWEATLGGRVGLVRYGTCDDAPNFRAWQLDLEGAAMTRLDWENNSDLEAADFRVGLLSTWRFNSIAIKAGYYHISSHLGDEFMVTNPTIQRRNYVRDSLIVGLFQNLTDSIGVYNEVAYAAGAQGGAEPLEFQTGIQYVPSEGTGRRGAPYAGFNANFRQEFGQDAGFNVVGGWLWRSDEHGHLLRIGAQYYNGPSLQYSFFDKHEELIGGGVWYDY